MQGPITQWHYWLYYSETR